MKVLVTGANGYIGSHVVEALISKGHEVLASDFSFDNVNEKAKKIKTSIFSDFDAKELFEKFESPDVIIHLAWRNGFQHNASSHIEDLPAHFNFVKKMIDSPLKQLVVMGSMHEVGYFEGAISSETPTNPQSLYGISKNSLRQITLSLSKDKDKVVQWLRGFYIVGDDIKGSSIFGKILSAVKEGKKEFPFTSGKNLYDFIDIQDLANQIATVASQSKYQGIINIGSGNPISLADRVEQFIKDNNLDIKLIYGAFPDRPYDSPGIWANTENIENIMREFGDE